METKGTAACETCSKNVTYYKSAYIGRQKRFCSRRCYSKVSAQNFGTRFTGRKHTAQTIQKIKDAWNTKKHPSWKGDKASYQTIHIWVRRHKGAPQGCEHCGHDEPDRVYEWANISGRYLRDLNDYKRVCQKCHRAHYDNAIRKVSKGHFVQ